MGNCSLDICNKLVETDEFGFSYCTCSAGCISQSGEDETTGRCMCVTGFIAPGCVEECSGACAIPPTDNGLTQLCKDTNRCTCQYGCEAEDYFDVTGNISPPREYVELNTFDPGFPEYETCTCHCANGMTGINCDKLLTNCHARCDPAGGCQDEKTSTSHCGSCVLHAHRNSQNECTCDPGWGNPEATDDIENDCSVYIGVCVPRCEDCFGPDADECLTCMPNAEFGADLFDGDVNFCECMEGWRGIDCSIYIGICIDRCASCTDGIGCDMCMQNAEWDPFSLTCECSHGYTGDNCEHYTGSCND